MKKKEKSQRLPHETRTKWQERKNIVGRRGVNTQGAFPELPLILHFLFSPLPSSGRGREKEGVRNNSKQGCVVVAAVDV